MGNAILVNFAGGETSSKSRGRFDIASYNSSCRKLVNYIAEVSGPARFRPGFKHIAPTYRDLAARIIPFQLNDEQAYLLEFTPGKMRVYKNGAQIRTLITTITGITQANPAVVTVADASGIDVSGAPIEFVLDGIVGMTELNKRVVTFFNKVGSTLGLRSSVPSGGADIDSRTFDAYVSGGSIYQVYEIATPYLSADDLAYIQFAQTKNAMYLTHYKYPPQKLVVGSDDRFTIGTYSRTSDPLNVGTAVNITGVYKGTQGGIEVANGTYIFPDTIYTFASVGGATELNGKSYRLVYYPIPLSAGNTHYKFRDVTTGEVVNTSAWGTWTSGGTATPAADYPIACAFYENRFIFGGTNLRPSTLFLSRAPDSAGVSRFDDFTGGTDADHACFFTLAPVNGTVDYIAWAGGTSKYLLVGTFGGPFRISGSGLDEPITPSSINVKQLDAFGCAAVAPALNGSQAYFIQRGGMTLRGIKFDANVDDFVTYDLCLNADQIGVSEMKRVVLQANRPDLLWVVREDGVLCGMTVQSGERVAGWHRHKIGGTDAKVIDVAVLPRPGAEDQIYIVTERTVNGGTKHCVEVMADDVIYPDPEDFYSAESAQAANEEDYMDAVYRLQERYVHVDAAATYNGSDAGYAASSTLTPSAATVGTGRTFTASVSVFTAADVGKEIWKKPSAVDGTGSGRATITAYVSGTEVTAEITAAFDSTSAIPAGDWYLAVDEVSGLRHLEGERVAVIADGAVYSDGKTADYPVVTVTNGAIELSRNCAVVTVGLPYEGMLITHNLEMGGATGPAQDKPRNIARMAIRFQNSLGCEFGTSLYRTEKIVHNSNKYVSDRPTPVFSGVKIVHNSDTWKPDSGDKNVVVVQKLPLPCIVQFIDVHYETGDEA